MKAGYFSIFLVFAIFAVSSVNGQSRDQKAPTPFTGPETSGRIVARDMGDPRTTAYYFAIQATPGELSIEISFSNFSGDLDVFSADGLRPKAKVTVFPGTDSWSGTRTVYARQRELLLIRIDGRTPNDDPAAYRIVLKGSFEPLPAPAVSEKSEPSAIEIPKEGERRSSVGGVVEVFRTDSPGQGAGGRGSTTGGRAGNQGKASQSVPKKEPTNGSQPTPQPRQVKTSAPVTGSNRSGAAQQPPLSGAPPRKAPDAAPVDSRVLRVRFKSGEGFERSMSEVSRVLLDKGVLTVTTTDGRTRIISLSEVTDFSIR